MKTAIVHDWLNQIGGAEDVEVIELMVVVGDTISEGDTMLVLEKDPKNGEAALFLKRIKSKL